MIYSENRWPLFRIMPASWPDGLASGPLQPVGLEQDMHFFGLRPQREADHHEGQEW